MFISLSYIHIRYMYTIFTCCVYIAMHIYAGFVKDFRR